MANFTIPELIIPGALYVPDANNFFEIESASLPNGDDALVVRGDVNRDYKALQLAPTLSPNAFKDRQAVAWAMSFWIWLPNLTIAASGSYRSDQILFSVMSRIANNAANGGEFHLQTPNDYANSNGLTAEIEWAVCRYSNASGVAGCHLGFVRQTDQRNSTPGLSGGQSSIWSTSLTPNTWTQIIINIPSPFRTAPTGYVNNGAVVNGSQSSGGFSAVIPEPTKNRYLCIGSYSDGTNLNGADGLWKIAKLRFHSRVLDAADRSTLYNAMTT